MNPADMMKFFNAKKTFEGNHPKFVAFLRDVMRQGVQEDTVIEISLTRPGQETITTNMKIRQSDLDLLEELKNMPKMN